jgi:hypothetical protein
MAIPEKIFTTEGTENILVRLLFFTLCTSASSVVQKTVAESERYQDRNHTFDQS